MPIYEYDIDVYIEVTLSNSGVVETNNKIYTTSNFPEHASIERDGYGAIHSSRVYYGSTLKYIIPSNVSTSSIGWKYINNDMKTVNGTTVTVTDSSLVEAESNINGANVVQT
jgi:effector-binding domain-containing protein